MNCTSLSGSRGLWRGLYVLFIILLKSKNKSKNQKFNIRLHAIYIGDSKTGRVKFSNGQKKVGSQMVWLFNGSVFKWSKQDCVRNIWFLKGLFA